MISTFIRNLIGQGPEDKSLVVSRKGELGKELVLAGFRVLFWEDKNIAESGGYDNCTRMCTPGVTQMYLFKIFKILKSMLHKIHRSKKCECGE